jgi:hypothetical protein
MHTRLQLIEIMTKIYESLPSGSLQRLLRALITDHVREHSATFYKHLLAASEGYGLKAENALFKAFIEAYPYWMCSFDEYCEVLHEIHPVQTASNPSKQ